MDNPGTLKFEKIQTFVSEDHSSKAHGALMEGGAPDFRASKTSFGFALEIGRSSEDKGTAT